MTSSTSPDAKNSDLLLVLAFHRHYCSSESRRQAMNSMDNLPHKVAAKLQDLEDEDDDIDYTIPSTWGVDNISNAFSSQSQAIHSTSSVSGKFATPNSMRDFARAFAPIKTRVDPYELYDQGCRFSFSSVIRGVPQASSWDSYDPTSRDQSQLRKSQQRVGQDTAARCRYDTHDLRNRALEGAFGSTSVKHVIEEGAEAHNTAQTGIDSRLEDPKLDIDPNVRANFRTIEQFHLAPVQHSAFAMRNPTLIATNTNAPISTIIAGKTVTYNPKPIDSRVSKLDRHGKYIGKDLGDISKRLKLQHKENVRERDRQMLQATAEYRALLAMSPEERAELLERLRKPFEFYGAFEEDQHDMVIPDVYIRDASTSRAMTSMEGSPSRGINMEDTNMAHNVTATSDPMSVLGSHESTDNSWTPRGDFGDWDDFAMDSSYTPLSKPPPRDLEYFKNALHYGRMQGPRITASQHLSVARAQITSYPGRTLSSDAGTSQSGVASSHRIQDPLSFDDSPEFQIPEDSTIECQAQLTPKEMQLFRDATDISLKHGRVVLLRLHDPVKFTPGAIARRVFGGIIQEMQLFPSQREAIVVFLHASEAKAFLRHVKATYEVGNAHEIRMLQIEAGWYK